MGADLGSVMTDPRGLGGGAGAEAAHAHMTVASLPASMHSRQALKTDHTRLSEIMGRWQALFTSELGVSGSMSVGETEISASRVMERLRHLREDVKQAGRVVSALVCAYVHARGRGQVRWCAGARVFAHGNMERSS